MPKYKKKPVTKLIDAIQFDGENFDEVVAFCKGNIVHDKKTGGDQNGNGHPQLYQKLTIETIHQGQKVELVKGDYVIPEADGVHFYPCKPDVFAETYELVEA